MLKRLKQPLNDFVRNAPALVGFQQVPGGPQQVPGDRERVDTFVENLEVKPGFFYTGYASGGTPHGEGRLTLPRSTGAITGQFSKKPGEELIMRGASLRYKNGDIVSAHFFNERYGVVVPTSNFFTYSYANGRRVTVEQFNEAFEVHPELNLSWATCAHFSLSKSICEVADGLRQSDKEHHAYLTPRESFNAHRPQEHLSAALLKISTYVASKNVDASWNQQENLLAGLQLYFGPALPYAQKDVAGTTIFHKPFQAYATQLEHVVSTMFTSSAFVTLRLFSGVCSGPGNKKGGIIMQFHPEEDEKMRQTLRRTVEDKAALLLAAYQYDVAAPSAPDLPTIHAVLQNAFAAGPCHNGQITSMSETLIERGVIEPVAATVIDIRGVDINQDVSNVAAVFRVKILSDIRNENASARGLSDTQIEATGAFSIRHTASKFKDYLKGTKLGSSMTPEQLEEAIEWQVSVVGVLS